MLLTGIFGQVNGDVKVKIGEGKQKSYINFLALNWKFKFELLKKCPSAVCFKGLEKT